RSIQIAQSRYIRDQSLEVIFNDLLNDLLSITGSEYGFIGETHKKEDGTLYLKTRAITNIAWNEETQKFYQENAPMGLEFYNLKSLFGEVLVSKKYVISNDPKNDPRGCGIPAGHPDLNAFLGIPFFFNDELIGMAGIANRSEGFYDEIVDELKPFTSTCANIISADRTFRERREMESHKDEFVSIVSHELKTPMASILASLKMFKDVKAGTLELSKQETDEILEIAIQNGERMNRIIGDLLNFNKLERKNLPMVLDTHNLDDLLKKSFITFKDMFDKNKIAFKLESDPSLTICTDKDRFLQVIGNLLENAIKYSDSRTEVKLIAKESSSNILIQVIDQGRGIPAESMKNLFKSFYQVDASDSRSHTGIGLGLSICRLILNEMSGSIEVQSEIGKGSTFSILLPKVCPIN
ncbi:MAG: GHKL domain-containing protein, partial [Deltaproteobacteria bacterium]